MIDLSKRERKVLFIAMIVNALIFSVIGWFLFTAGPTPEAFIGFLVFMVVLQFAVFFTPGIIEKFFIPANPEIRTKELETKIAILQEEIKMVNGEDYKEINHDF